MARIKFIQGEGKPVTVRVTEKNRPVVIPVDATLLLGVKRNKEDVDYIFSIEDDDFNRSQAASGILSFSITPEHTGIAPGIYLAQLKIVFAIGPPELTSITDPFEIEIEKAIVNGEEDEEGGGEEP